MPLPVARPLSKYTRNRGCRKARDASPESESVNQFCIGHLRERVRAPDPEAPRGAVVGDAAQVSDQQRRRRGFQADGVAVVQAKWRPRRAAPSALDSVNASRANTLGGGGRTGWARAPRRAAAVRRQERQPVAGLDCVVMRHRHPFESQPRYCRTRAPRQSTSFLRLWRLLTVTAHLVRPPRPTRRTLRSVGAPRWAVGCRAPVAERARREPRPVGDAGAAAGGANHEQAQPLGSHLRLLVGLQIGNRTVDPPLGVLGHQFRELVQPPDETIDVRAPSGWS